MRLDIVRKEEGQRDWGSSYRTRKRRSCEVTPIGPVDEPKESYTGARQIEICVAPSHGDAKTMRF